MVFKEDAYREVFPAQVETPVKPKTESMIEDLEDEAPEEEVKQVEQAQKEKPEDPEQESMKPDQEEGTNEL